MQTYNQRDASRKRTDYLYKKQYYLPKQLAAAYRKVRELEDCARDFGMTDIIDPTFTKENPDQ